MTNDDTRDAVLAPSTREFLQGIIDNIADPVFVKDEQHRWLVLNDAMCRFFGTPREALIGRSDFDFFPEEEARVFWEKDELVFRTGGVNVNEEHLTDAAGVRHTISTKKAIFACDGRRFLVGVIRDITEIKRTQAELENKSRELLRAKERAEQAARSKDEFLANTSHELRTPMNAVLGMADLMLSSELGEQQRRYATLIREGATHLATLIDDILDLTRINVGKVDVAALPFDPAEMLRRAAAMFDGQARERGLSLHVELAPLPDSLVGDARRLRQVVVNLLSNALKFTSAGDVTLRARAEPHVDQREHDVAASGASAAPTSHATQRVMFEIEVCDSGIGIAAEEIEQIFERFRQLDASPTRRHGGLGLGLAISNGLVGAMGGELDVQSRLGEGSRFVVRVPLALAAGVVDDERAEAARFADTARTHPLDVLVVEDNAVNRQVMRALLQRLGYRAEVANDGHAALEAMVRDGRRFDVVLMDVHMPGIDGLETTRRLRAALADAEQPAIIGVTASALPRDRLACIEAGMNAYLSKPVRPTALRDALREHGRRDESAIAGAREATTAAE